MKLPALALSLALIAAPALAEEPVAAGEVLGGDFVEVGNLPPGLSRDLAMVELVNASGHAVTAAVGDGTASLAKDDRLVLRIAPGEVAVLITATDRADLRLEGRILIERARRYALEVFVGVPQPEAGAGAAAPPETPRGVGRRPPGESGQSVGKTTTAPTETGAATKAPAATEAPAEPSKEAEASAKKARRTGKVDIGRKRPRDRH